MKFKSYYVFLASQKYGTHYIGVTNDLLRRIHEHKTNVIAGFTKEYRVHTLVHFEQFDPIKAAIQREKNLRKWKRQWKLNLIDKDNPNWDDLYHGLLE